MGNRKGFALYLVLVVMLVVVILANVIFNTATSQTRLTRHQIKRIQAYYAAQAGINLALEKLRLNDPDWLTDASGPWVRHICRQADGVAPCIAPIAPPNTIDADLPEGIRCVDISVGPPLVAQNNRRTISATVQYEE